MSLRILSALFLVMLGTSSAYAAGDASKATAAAAVCAACHGADGNSAVSMYPKLAGQHPEYITKQLKNFKAGERNNAIMSGMAAGLTPEDMENLGAYFGGQAPKTDVAKSNGPGSVGEKIYKGGIPGVGVPACASCHGPAGAGIPVQFPRLAGQHSDYIVTQMKAWRSGERANDAAKMMRMVSAKLSDADIAAVADYIQGLR
ncbi:MAG TPA: c-type cytochrome [Methylophilaceae bacterium]|nr:c-type cytochrome [Methylophilaceae bacterium]